MNRQVGDQYETEYMGMVFIVTVVEVTTDQYGNVVVRETMTLKK